VAQAGGGVAPMPVVFVIHSDQDQSFVEAHVLRALPALGFDSWISGLRLLADDTDPAASERAMRGSAATIAILSDAALGSAAVREQVTLAARGGRPFIPVRVGSASRERWGSALQSRAGVECPGPAAAEAVDDWLLWNDLAALLPAVAGRNGATAPEGTGELESMLPAVAGIPWDAAAFSRFLEEALVRHDYNRTESLVAALARHPGANAHPYPAPHARADLATLRSYRQFSLMRRYAERVLAAGSTDFRVRRQYGQALIELSDFPAAVRTLEAIAAEAPPGDHEPYEARGLLGRVYKQQYVNAPAAPAAREHLRRAIEMYSGVFRESPENVWHGINTASLLLRAARDGQDGGSREDARAIARQILATLAKREGTEVFDLATRVEAHVALEEFDAASRALDEYLAHPEMHAFEVSSTYRQFDEVLQLHADPRAAALMDRLWRAVERHRTGGLSLLAGDREGLDAGPSAARPFVVRVSDPDWQPAADIPGLQLKGRLGTIVSIVGSEETIKGLMKDPLVISVEQSRPSKLTDCARSVPFIRATDPFTGPAGAFSENGDRALVVVIDDGIDILHEAFLDADGSSRLVGVWDQRDSAGPPPAASGLGAELDFGTYHTREQIAACILANKGLPPESVELPKGLRDRNADGHGTHVASIAAGRPTESFAGGVAPGARLLFVISAGGESTGYSQAHLAALTFVDRVAASLSMPVVVNVSQGMNAGAHDGKSAVEVGFDEFSKGGRKPGRVIVKSAGNEGDRAGHAKLVPPAGGVMRLAWTCDDPEQVWLGDQIELWWNSANQYRFRLQEPDGGTSEWIDLAQPEVSGKLRGVRYTLKLVRRHVDNGDSRLTLQLGNGFTTIPAGRWSLTVQSVKVAEAGAIHAWIERDASSRSKFLTNADQELTVTVPGTAQTVITVAAVAVPDPVDEAVEAGDFSSYGPTRDGRSKPDVAAPGVNIIAARGGTRTGARPESGTSMAAPHVTGAIALLLSKSAKAAGQDDWPTATQIAKALTQNTRQYNGQWTPSQGWGVLDVAALLQGI
jgi:endonuclease G